MSESPDRTAQLVGVEASVSTMKAVTLNENGSIVASVSASVAAEKPIVEQLVEFINDVAGKFGKIGRIGIAVPGLISRDTRRVAFSAHIPEHSEADLAEFVRAECGVAALVENDANAAAYGEYTLGAGRGSRNMFYATLGHGVGGAFILDGEIWRGSSGYAGEFGYMTLNSEGLRLEDVASTENIVRRTRDRFSRDSTSSLRSEDSIQIEDIVAAAEDGDDFARLMLERTGQYVGTAVASVINLLNVEMVVLGGAVMQAGSLVLDPVIARAREMSFAPSFSGVTIAAGSLGENAAAIGVAQMAARPDRGQ